MHTIKWRKVPGRTIPGFVITHDGRTFATPGFSGYVHPGVSIAGCPPADGRQPAMLAAARLARSALFGGGATMRHSGWMTTWTVRTDRAMSSIAARRHREEPVDAADRYEDHGEWRLFFNDGELIAVRNDSAFHRRLDLAPIAALLPGNVVSELRRIADAALVATGDLSVTVHTSSGPP